MSSPQRPSSSSSTTSATNASGSNSISSSRDSGNGTPSTSMLYNFIMTPINFTAFILSLVLIDLRYSLQRKHTHSESRTRLPAWLHALLYRPYENDRTKAAVPAEGQWYYHTKQKKLFKMEADEAFRLRNTMLVLLGLVSLGSVAGAWYAMNRIYQHWNPISYYY